MVNEWGFAKLRTRENICNYSTTNTNENDVVSDLQCDLDNISKWFDLNRLSVNIDKSCSMYVTKRQHSDTLELTMNDNMLGLVTDVQYLGITLCDDLSWKKQISNVCRKLGYGISILYRIRKILNQADMIKLYNTIIQPHIDYCITIWGYSPISQTHRVQRLQNRISRLMTNNYDFTVSPSVLLKQLGIMNVKQIRDYFMAIQMFKCLNGMSPTYLSDRIDYVNDHTSRSTHSSTNNNLYVPRPRIEKFRESLQYAGPTLYNSLPNYVKDSVNIASFKYHFKKYCFNVLF